MRASGANLVINRKSLNVESKLHRDLQIRYENQRIMEKL